ncbi:AbfB domain-containing protein [Algicola sagamiensis]|uniref:AbfB domain-containing protein n=1 Tax=Algicola sagamiensis TaxID=163869 RepID=UPI00035DB945|nr:AbfB domain-containing protein [Algicola sagamiensis]
MKKNRYILGLLLLASSFVSTAAQIYADHCRGINVDVNIEIFNGNDSAMWIPYGKAKMGVNAQNRLDCARNQGSCKLRMWPVTSPKQHAKVYTLSHDSRFYFCNILGNNSLPEILPLRGSCSNAWLCRGEYPPRPIPDHISSDVPLNQIISLRSQNYPNMCLKHENFQMYLRPCDFNNNDFKFEVVPGLLDSDNKISFESVSHRGYYLRHKSYKMRMDKLSSSTDKLQLKSDASFWAVQSYADLNRFAFRIPFTDNLYLRHKNYAFIIDNVQTELDTKDTSFEFVVH